MSTSNEHATKVVDYLNSEIFEGERLSLLDLLDALGTFGLVLVESHDAASNYLEAIKEAKR